MHESPDDVIAFGEGLVGNLRALAGALMALGIVVGIGGMPVGPAFAGVRESAFFIAPGGASVVFDVRGVPRREVVDRLLAGRAVVLEWLDDALADEPITGVFNGSAEAVLQRLLAQTNFVVVYDRSGDQPRISRLTILGKAAKPRAPELTGPGPLPAPGAPAPAAAIPAPPATPVLIPPPSGDRAAPPPILPSAGATPPNLVPLPAPPSDIFSPLRPPPANATPPKLVPMSSTEPPPLVPAPGARQR